MTCKNCLHYDVCLNTEHMVEISPHCREELQEIDCVESYCEQFKDKSRFVELPYKVGEVVYCIHNKKIKPCAVLAYYIDHAGLLYDIKMSNNNCKPNDLTSINTIIASTDCELFTTREDAAKKLKQID